MYLRKMKFFGRGTEKQEVLLSCEKNSKNLTMAEGMKREGQKENGRKKTV